MEKRKVAIIGGGITGLAAAYQLERAKAKTYPIHYDLYEKADRLGGKIATIRHDGFIIERGPDSFLARKKSMTRLAEAVGLKDELVSNDTGQSYVLHGTKLYPIPKGAVMGIPTDVRPFLESKLFSRKSKLRAALDIIIPRVIDDDEDVSLGHFFRRRLGDEVVDRLIEPLLSGIYAGDIDRLSLKATFPNFQQLEKKYGSLIRGMKAMRPTSKGGAPKGIFLTFRQGLASFVDALEAQLDKDAVHKQTEVRAIEKDGEAYTVTLADGTKKRYDAVIVATPPHVTASLFRNYPYFRYLDEMKATSVANVALCFKEAAVSYPFEGTGFVVPSKSEYKMTACTWTNKKWRHSTPPGFALMRVFVGKPGDASIVDESDATIVKTVLAELRRAMKIDGEPEFFYVTRWKRAMPQYEVGHTYKIAKLKEDVDRHLPGVYVCGAAFEGIGLPDCIDQGERAATAVLRKFDENKKG